MNLVRLLLLIFVPVQKAYAHCDIPCGIYEPTPMQIAAHTVLRMMQLFEEQKSDVHSVVRIVHVKEDHGALVEKEIGTLKNDYFKPEHFKEFPELKDLMKDAIQLSAKTRQKVDIEMASELIEKTLQISEIFYKTKGFEPVRVPSGFPSGGELVTHK